MSQHSNDGLSCATDANLEANEAINVREARTTALIIGLAIALTLAVLALSIN